MTEVHLTLIPPRQGLFALARVVLNDALVLEGIGLHRKRDSQDYRLTYPTRNLPNGTCKTMFHPITPGLSKAIEEAIFREIALIQKDVDAHDRYCPTHLR